jgi:hypothetical protein
VPRDDVLFGPKPVFVRWTRDAAREAPGILRAMEAFEPVDLPAARACAEWLRTRALAEPAESATRLLLQHGALLGFYALANGHAELARGDRKRLGLHFVTQPAVILTQIARAAAAPEAGGLLMLHAVGTARRAAQLSAATVFALDPHDEATAAMWREKYGFRESERPAPGRPEALKRLWVPLTTT